MRHNKRTDNNQAEVIRQLRDRMFSVKVTSHIGHGFPDFIVRINGKARAVELKNKGKLKQLTQAEIELRDWLVAAGMKYMVAETVEEIEKEFK